MSDSPDSGFGRSDDDMLLQPAAIVTKDKKRRQPRRPSRASSKKKQKTSEKGPVAGRHPEGIDQESDGEEGEEDASAATQEKDSGASQQLASECFIQISDEERKQADRVLFRRISGQQNWSFSPDVWLSDADLKKWGPPDPDPSPAAKPFRASDSVYFRTRGHKVAPERIPKTRTSHEKPRKESFPSEKENICSKPSARNSNQQRETGRTGSSNNFTRPKRRPPVVPKPEKRKDHTCPKPQFHSQSHPPPPQFRSEPKESDRPQEQAPVLVRGLPAAVQWSFPDMMEYERAVTETPEYELAFETVHIWLCKRIEKKVTGVYERSQAELNQLKRSPVCLSHDQLKHMSYLMEEMRNLDQLKNTLIGVVHYKRLRAVPAIEASVRYLVSSSFHNAWSNS